MTSDLARSRAAASLLGPALLLGGCDAPGAPAAFGVSPPPPLAGARAVDRSRLRPIVTLDDGRSVGMRRLDDGSWSGTIDVLPGRVHTLRVVWIETIGDRELRLAAAERTLTVDAAGARVEIAAGDYDFEFDLDGDGVSNLAERENGTDPFRAPPGEDGPSAPIADPAVPSGFGEGDEDAEFPPASEIAAEVIVRRIAREDAPVVDGLGVVLDAGGRYGGEWAGATQLDASGDPLVIENLMVDAGTDETDGAPRRRWAVAHDGEYLYVLVVVDDGGRRFRDSEALWNDDSLEVYVDGNGSGSPIHDDDDVQRTLPLIAPDGGGVDEGIVPGFFLSQAPVEIDFATGPGLGPGGPGRDVYELRIELDSANVVPGRPFGFELQVNDDDDGGSREGKWGWAHPPRTTEDVDLTFFDPSYMGTAVAE